MALLLRGKCDLTTPDNKLDVQANAFQRWNPIACASGFFFVLNAITLPHRRWLFVSTFCFWSRIAIGKEPVEG